MQPVARIEGELEETDRTAPLQSLHAPPLVRAPLFETTEPIRILIADSLPASRQEFRRLLDCQSGFSVVGVVVDGVDAVRRVFAHHPDVLLLDVAIPDLSWLEVLKTFQRANLSVRTILLADDIDHRTMLDMLQLGAQGAVTRTTPGELVCKSIRKVNRGELWIGREIMTEVVTALASAAHVEESRAPADFGLTRREREIITLVVEGDTNKGIAARLSVGEGTVKHHLTSIFNKTGVSSRLELALFALHFHLVDTSK